MSSSKLNQSLDEILSTQQKNARRRRSTRRPGVSRPPTAAPAGGVKKSVKPARNAGKPTLAKSAGLVGESKIMVSNLPKDVSESQIKEYFQTAIGQVKKVELSYGPGGASRGTAHVTFQHADGASKAFSSLNGLLIDNRPVKVEVVVASADLIPQPKTLGQRITQPKVQPKSAASDKRGVNGVKAGANPKGVKKGVAAAAVRRGRNLRATKKTAEQLDSEMADYFEHANNNNDNSAGAGAGAGAGTGSAPAAANGDAPMEDDIL